MWCQRFLSHGDDTLLAGDASRRHLPAVLSRILLLVLVHVSANQLGESARRATAQAELPSTRTR